jgi:phosphate transport system substrate-binding protein
MENKGFSKIMQNIYDERIKIFAKKNRIFERTGGIMKSNKGYIVSLLIIQFVGIPAALPAILFALENGNSSILRFFLSGSGHGQYASKLLIILTASLGALIVGAAIGLIFSKLRKSKPNEAKARYLPLMIPLLYTGIIAALLTFMSGGDGESGLWIIYGLKNPAFIVFIFITAFMGLNFIIIITELMGYVGFVLGFLIHEGLNKSGLRDAHSRKIKAAFFLVCTVIVVSHGIAHKNIIKNGLIEVMYGESTLGGDLTEYDLFQIAPFRENNGLAKLDKPASLQFEEFNDMPKLDGATAMYPIYASFVEAVYKGLGNYMENNQNERSENMSNAFVSSYDYPLNIVKCTKTSNAYTRLVEGETDVIFALEPSKGHLEAIRAKGDEFVLTPIAHEAFVFFANVKNPVDNLSITQIQDIYSGKITNWRQAGGQNRKIIPFQRPENSGSQTIMLSKVMKNVQMLKPDMETYVGSMGRIISNVASYKNAKNSIGYSFMYYSSSMIKNNQIKYIAVDGISPTPQTVRDNSYPFTVPVYAVTLKSNNNENVSKFLEWILSEEGQELVEKTGYVPVK